MAELKDIVVVNITKESRGVTRQGFGIPLLLSPHMAFSDRVRSYTSSSGVLDDFGAGTPEYKAAQIAFSQDLKPTSLMIGRQRIGTIYSAVSTTLPTPTLVSTITVESVLAGGFYILRDSAGATLGGTLATSGQTTAQLATAWAAQIDLHADYSATAVGNVITVTKITAGAFAYLAMVHLTNAAGEPQPGELISVGGTATYFIVNEIATVDFQSRLIVFCGIAAAEDEADVVDHLESVYTGNGNLSNFLLLTDLTGGDYKVKALTTPTYVDFFRMEVDARQTIETTVFGRGDLTLINSDDTEDAGVSLGKIYDINKDWYGLITMGVSLGGAEEALVQDLAKDFVSANERIYIVLSADATIVDSSASADVTSIAYRYKAASVERVAILYQSSTPSTATLGQDDFADLAWMCRMLPTDPGSATWKFKTLRNVTVYGLTATQALNALAKNANTYESFAGTNITREGTMSSGEFIDVIVGLDWVVANMRADIFDGLANAPKIPFTNRGIATIANLVRSRLQLAVGQGIFSDDPAPEVITPDVADVDPADKAARFLKTVEWTATLQGAIHKVQVEGFVSI